MKKELKDYINAREMKRTGGHPESADFHSKGFHRYFDGYSEYKETDSKGKTRIRRVYTGVYHRQLLSDAQRKKVKLGYAFLWILSAALFSYSATRYLPGNFALWTAVCQAFSVFGLGWTLWSLFNYVTAGKNMTLDDYRYVQALKKSSGFTAAALAAAAAGPLVHTLLQGFTTQEALCGAAYLLSALSCWAIRLIENKIPYDSFLSQKEAPPQSGQITS